jgi:hypothetical protein
MPSQSFRATQLLSLAPTPTFALLGLLSATQESNLQHMICSAAHSTSPLTGMVSMYLLMSVFHCAPWLRRIGRYVAPKSAVNPAHRAPSHAQRGSQGPRLRPLPLE